MTKRNLIGKNGGTKNDAPRRGRRYYCTTQYTRNLRRAGRHSAFHIYIRKTNPISFKYFHLFSSELTLFAPEKHITGLLRCLFHIPLNFGGVMARNMERIEAAGAYGKNYVVLLAEV